MYGFIIQKLLISERRLNMNKKCSFDKNSKCDKCANSLTDKTCRGDKCGKVDYSGEYGCYEPKKEDKCGEKK